MSYVEIRYFGFCPAAPAAWTLFVRFGSLLLISIALFATTGGGWGEGDHGGHGWMCLLGLRALACAAKCKDAGLM